MNRFITDTKAVFDAVALIIEAIADVLEAITINGYNKH